MFQTIIRRRPRLSRKLQNKSKSENENETKPRTSMFNKPLVFCFHYSAAKKVTRIPLDQLEVLRAS